MWTREELKSRAKDVLRGSYWKAFAISLILAFAMGGKGGYGGSGGTNTGRSGGFTGGSMSNEDIAMIAIIVLIAVIVMLLVLAFRIFVGYALEVGCRRYFVKSAQNDVNMNYMGYAFNKQKYMDVLKAMLWKGLFNTLWFFAFIIPGIVKSYSYRMTPYILGDNPNIGYKRALKLSMDMTNGQKADMFVLDLSFIGWYLLGFLACCVGMLFVAPYANATEAELYLVLRKNALDNGMCTYEELLLDLPTEGNDIDPQQLI